MSLINETHSRRTLFVQVILPLFIPKTYTYRVPNDWNDRIRIGLRVIVQFGRSKIYSGIIKSFDETAPAAYEAKYILDIVDDSPIVTPLQLEFWEWMSSYYMCYIGEVMQAALPAALKLASETKITAVHNGVLNRSELSDKEFLIMDALDLAGELKVNDVVKLLGQKTVFPLLKTLFEKGFLNISEKVAEKYKPKTKQFLKLNPTLNNATGREEVLNSLNNAPKQQDALLGYIQLERRGEKVSRSLLMELTGVGAGSIKALIDKDVFQLEEKVVSRLDYEEQLGFSSFGLNEEQEIALSSIRSQFAEKDVVLLHGVTASGKTQIYIKVIEEIIQSGKTALYLLPEIALTSQITERLKLYFGDQLAVYHSKFNDNERVEIWRKVIEGKCKIVVGARSAVFLPFKNLGLIVVDEEHESSYKQYEPAPRYHARDAAIYLAHMSEAKVLLGSATPSIESYYNAKAGKYGFTELNIRYGSATQPMLQIIDVKERSKADKMVSYFSSDLLEAIEGALSRKEQIILFQNRRGHSTFLQCKTCGHVAKCVNCDVSMTYHKSSNLLHCHYCGYSDIPIEVCPACGSPSIQSKGYGTERVEEELEILLPDAKIGRLDLDSAKGKYGFEKVIGAFEDHEIDILIGTQMVAKGLDFGKVSVIGVINADSIINFPDFRSYERAFSLFSQVSGRAGRRGLEGKVLIQTYTPEHRVLKQVLNHSYEDMFMTEIKERKNFKYPPFYRLIRVEVKSPDVYQCESAAKDLALHFKSFLAHRVLGPEPALVSRVRKNFIQIITLKIERDEISIGKVKQMLNQSILEFMSIKKNRGIIIHVDVDPF